MERTVTIPLEEYLDLKKSQEIVRSGKSDVYIRIDSGWYYTVTRDELLKGMESMLNTKSEIIEALYNERARLNRQIEDQEEMTSSFNPYVFAAGGITGALISMILYVLIKCTA